MNDRVFNFHFLKISLACILLTSATQIIMVILPLFVQHLGRSPSELGTATALSALAAMVARPVSGHFADKKSKQAVMIVGLLLMAVGMAGFHFLPFMAAVVFIRFIQGFGISAATTGQIAIATDVLPASQVKKGLSYFAICTTLAGALGPTLGLALVFGDNYMPAWLGGTVLFVIALLIVASIRYDKSGADGAAVNESTNQFKGLWRYFEKSAIKPSLIYLVIMIAHAGAIVFLPIYAIEIGIENVGIFYILQASSMLVSNILVGKIIGRLRNPLFLLLFSVVCYGGALFTLFIANGMAAFALAAVLYGFGMGMCSTTVSAVTMSSTTPERRGAASATFQVAMDIGFCIGSFALGIVAGLFGYRSLYGIISIFPVLAAVMCLLFFIRKSDSKSPA